MLDSNIQHIGYQNPIYWFCVLFFLGWGWDDGSYSSKFMVGVKSTIPPIYRMDAHKTPIYILAQTRINSDSYGKFSMDIPMVIYKKKKKKKKVFCIQHVGFSVSNILDFTIQHVGFSVSNILDLAKISIFPIYWIVDPIYWILDPIYWMAKI